MENGGQQRSTHTAIIILLFVAAALFLAAGAVMIMQSDGNIPDWPDVENIDASATEMSPTLKARLFGVKLNDAGKFSYSVRKEITVDAETGESVIELKNPAENIYLMAAEITLSGSDEVIYRSGYFKPNTQIESIRLKKIPSVDEHDATVYFYAFDFDTLDMLGIIEQPISLTVE